MDFKISIHVEHLRKKLGTTQALDDLTAHFDVGRMYGLVGPEGAGKTTLLRHIIGLLKQDEGTIQYFNDRAPVKFDDVRAQLAYMPQQQSLYPDLSIGEHLDFFRALYQIPHDIYIQRRNELLHITRLDSFVERSASQLSGGMYKKLGLMCALLRTPRVILLDEPTNGVDPISRREFWELLHRLSDSNTLIIVTTAYMDEAERCGFVHLMNEGKVIASGEPRSLLEAAHVESFDQYFLKKVPEATHG